MSKNKTISDEDFTSWKDNEITQAVMNYLRERSDRAAEVWVNSMHANYTERELLLLKVELQAKREFIEEFIHLELGDIQSNDARTPAVQIQPPQRRGQRARAT